MPLLPFLCSLGPLHPVTFTIFSTCCRYFVHIVVWLMLSTGIMPWCRVDVSWSSGHVISHGGHVLSVLKMIMLEGVVVLKVLSNLNEKPEITRNMSRDHKLCETAKFNFCAPSLILSSTTCRSLNTLTPFWCPPCCLLWHHPPPTLLLLPRWSTCFGVTLTRQWMQCRAVVAAVGVSEDGPGGAHSHSGVFPFLC